MQRSATRAFAFGLVVAGGVLLSPSSAQASTFTVGKGDTLASIAARNFLPVGLLQQANPQILDPTRLFQGDKLSLPQMLFGSLVSTVASKLTSGNSVVASFLKGFLGGSNATPSTFSAPAVSSSPFGNVSVPGVNFNSGGVSLNIGPVLPGSALALDATADAPALAPVTPSAPAPSNAAPATPAAPLSTAPAKAAPAPAKGAPAAPTQGLQAQGTAQAGGTSNAGTAAIDAIRSGKLINPNTGNTNWSTWCLALVRTAFKKATGRNLPELSAGTAWGAYQAFQKEGLVKQGTPPRGALVFWSPQERARMAPKSAGARCGHIAISNGDGTVISNVRRGGRFDSGGGIGTRVPMSAFGNPAGYVVVAK